MSSPASTSGRRALCRQPFQRNPQVCKFDHTGGGGAGDGRTAPRHRRPAAGAHDTRKPAGRPSPRSSPSALTTAPGSWSMTVSSTRRGRDRRFHLPAGGFPEQLANGTLIGALGACREDLHSIAYCGIAACRAKPSSDTVPRSIRLHRRAVHADVPRIQPSPSPRPTRARLRIPAAAPPGGGASPVARWRMDGPEGVPAARNRRCTGDGTCTRSQYRAATPAH